MTRNQRESIVKILQSLIKDVKDGKVETIDYSDKFPVNRHWNYRKFKWEFSRFGCVRDIYIGFTYYPKGLDDE